MARNRLKIRFIEPARNRLRTSLWPGHQKLDPEPSCDARTSAPLCGPSVGPVGTFYPSTSIVLRKSGPSHASYAYFRIDSVSGRAIDIDINFEQVEIDCGSSNRCDNGESHKRRDNLSPYLSLSLSELLSSSMAKRPCPSSSSTTSSSPLSQMDQLLDTFLSLADSSPSLSLDLSFERLVDASPDDSDQSILIDRALKLGNLLVEAGNRSARRRASKHNSLAWALPTDLTIKVFSMLDTQSLCYSAATCTLFRKCAMDPLCYESIDLTTVVPKINNAVVYTMIQRAGKALRSLKLGIVPGPTTSTGPSQALAYTIRNAGDASNFSWNDKKTRHGKESSILTRSCLNPLCGHSGAAGSLLRSLHLYNIERMDNTSLCVALAACPTLLDLEIVGLHVELRQTLTSISENCHSIERLFFESSKTGRDDSLKSPTCIEFVNNCPRLTSLALRGFKLQDCKVRTLVKGFRHLKYADFSTSYSITGLFLRNLGNCAPGNLLEVLNLRDCMHLKEVEVARFLTAVLAGEYKTLRHLDISNREGLASEGDWYERCYNSSIIPLKQVMEERPNICLLAEFPSEGSFANVEQMIDSDLEFSIPSQLSSHTSDGPSLMSTSESSYNSDQSTGNEAQDSGSVVYEESSDEVDFLTS
ncbi:F-box protein SKIP17-like [Rutidosis leptorrhynchoides]|uniref:F-box protein SKIP17-like n=1 Tax=Rutidosis leptorrhynchoides TaxID=125765 RepID=UPI003A99A44D